MLSDATASKDLSEFLRYLAKAQGGEDSRLPPLHEIAKDLGVSIASLREQLEVARVMGLIEIRPKTGLRKLPYTFAPIVKQSLAYGNSFNSSLFDQFSDLRNHLEAAYWMQAVNLLTESDHIFLKELVKSARSKLHCVPIQIPHAEHRELHLSIYKRLDNTFVKDLLTVYWDMYEEVGLNQFTDINYLEGVWGYHERMIEAICTSQLEIGYRALIDHLALINRRSIRRSASKFE